MSMMLRIAIGLAVMRRMMEARAKEPEGLGHQ
jgi:hypothetical protein